MGHAQQREHHARELPPGGDFSQWACGDAGIDGNLELHRLRPPRPAAVGPARQADVERRIGHRQLRQALSHGVGQCRGRGVAPLRELSGEPVELLARGCQFPLGAVKREVRPLELIAAGRTACRVVEHVGDGATVLSLQPRKQLEALFDRVQPTGSASLAAVQLEGVTPKLAA